jgi:outer membrane protein assembly factor BamD (BamD/ComL family)
MSIVGILASNFFSARATHHSANAAQTGQSNPSTFQQIRTEFQQLGQDLQSGNLTQAQSDYATLSQNFPGGPPGAATTPAAASTATAASAATTVPPSITGNNSVAQAFTQLGQDLTSGNLQAAQQDYANLQQDVQQAGQLNASQQVGGHHHRHHHHGGGGTQAASSASSSQQNSVNQAFSTLAQDLQAGNLSGAQSAFATLQNDLQQIGGFLPPTRSSGPTSTPATGSTGNLNVTA